MRKNWKTFAWVAAAILSVWLSGGATTAYLTAQAEKENRIKTGAVTIEIREEYTPPTDPVPGQTFVKKPWIVNQSSIPCYIRARVCFSSSQAQALCQPLQIGEQWTAGEEGWWYCQDAIPAQEASPALFTSVTLKDTISQEDLQAALPFDIWVYAEAVSALDGDRDAAWKSVEGGARHA